MYLHKDKKSGIYKYRREYPQDLIAVVGKKWFIRTLSTKDLKAANERFTDADSEYNDTVNQHKISQYVITTQTQKRLLPTLQLYSVRPFSVRSKVVSFSELVMASRHAADKISLIYKKLALHGEDAEIFAILGLNNNASAKTALPVWKNVFLQIENALREARGEELATENQCDAILADLDIEPLSIRVTPQQTHVSQSKQVISNGKEGIIVSEAFELWKKDTDCASKNVVDRGYAVRRFIELFGDKRIVDIKRSDFMEYIKEVKRLPARAPHSIRKLPIQDVLKLIDAGKLDDSDKLASRTVKKMCDGLRAIIARAIETNDLSINNPAGNLNIKVKSKSKRHGFSDDDLNKFFHSPIYTGYSDDKRTVGGESITRDALYWIPLIALYTGARLEEIAQLRVDDIKVLNKVPYFRISEAHEDQKLKNEGSERDVPIHNELINCGFMEYVEELRSDKTVRLFPELKSRNLDDRYGKEFSKQFNAYLVFLDIKPPKKELILKDFHSFRHLFKTAGRIAGISKQYGNLITGHTSGSDISDGYGEFPISIINDAMQKVKYPELDLSHLYVDDRKPKLRVRTAPHKRKKVF